MIMMIEVAILKWRRKKGRNVFIGGFVGHRFQAITRHLAIHSLLHDDDDDDDDDYDDDGDDGYFSLSGMFS